MTLGTILLASALTAALAFFLVHTFLHLTLVAAVVGALAACLPFGYVSYTRSKRLLKFEEQFPEAIDLLSRALRAGHALTTGLSMVAEELPDPIGPEFQTLYDQQNFGMPLSQALKNFADRVVCLDARFFVTAVLTQKESGGNLSEVLDNLAHDYPGSVQGQASGQGYFRTRPHYGVGAVGAADDAGLVLRLQQPGEIRHLLP